jgi:Fe-S-cluster containining protein
VNRHQRRAEESEARSAAKVRANDVMRRLTRNAERFDAELQQRIDASGRRADITCSAGCAACCDQALMLTFAEALHIVEKYEPLVRSLLPTLIEHDNIMLDAPFDMNRVSTITDPSTTTYRDTFLKWWFGRRIPCAFLDAETKRCRIYDRRPLACRSHLVMDDPKICEDVGADNNVFNPGMPYVEAMQRNWEETAQIIGAPMLGFMPSVIKYVLGIAPAPRQL